MQVLYTSDESPRASNYASKYSSILRRLGYNNISFIFVVREFFPSKIYKIASVLCPGFISFANDVTCNDRYLG